MYLNFLRNDALNANTFFRNLNGQPREVLKRNQFGFTVGGPIEIPKVIHGQRPLFLLLRLPGATAGATAIASGRQRIYAGRAQRVITRVPTQRAPAQTRE